MMEGRRLDPSNECDVRRYPWGDLVGGRSSLPIIAVTDLRLVYSFASEVSSTTSSLDLTESSESASMRRFIMSIRPS